MANIPVLDLRPQLLSIKGEIMAAVEAVIDSTAYINGPATQQFEKEAAQYLGVKHAIGLNSGTDALIIGMRALGVKPGDEVITTPFSFFATAESISMIGATPVFVDIEKGSFNIDCSLIEQAITDKTTAIMPVHIFGRPCNILEIVALAEKHGLKVIEDCAQSFGATVDGKQTGSFGNGGAFSFFPTRINAPTIFLTILCRNALALIVILNNLSCCSIRISFISRIGLAAWQDTARKLV